MDSTEEINIQLRNWKNYYSNYRKYKKIGNITNASELLWGVVASSLNVVAPSLYNFKATSHDDYRKLLERIEYTEPAKANDVKSQFEAAERLHSNFYHGWMTAR